MKITLPLDKLKKALKDIAPAITNSPVVPVLDNFIVEVKKNVVTVIGSDLQTTIKSKFNISNQKDALLCMPFAKCKGILDSLNTVDIDIDYSAEGEGMVKNHKYTLTSGKSKATVTGEDANVFPMTPEISENEKSFTIKFSDLNQAVFKTKFAMSNDELRPGINVINMILKDGVASFRAIDMSNAAIFKCEEIGSDEEIEASFTRGLLKANMFQDHELLTVRFSDQNFEIVGENNIIISRMQEEKFAPIDQLFVNMEEEGSVTMDRALLINQLSLAQKLSDSYTTGVRFKMEQSKVTLTAKNIDYGDDYHGEIEADLIGKDREIHISANKTLEILKRCEEEFITLKYYTNKPFIIISEKNFDCMTSFVQKFD